MPSVAPHRRFVSVELPFCLPITTNRTSDSNDTNNNNNPGLREEDRRMLEAFIPPSFLRPCLDEAIGSEKERVEVATVLKQQQEKEKEEKPAMIAIPSEYCTSEVFSGWRPLDFDCEEVTFDSKGTRNNNNISGNTSLTKSASEEGKLEREKMLRESFPSFIPQLLLQGFYRNDILVEVKRIRRVKRLRDPNTGKIIEEKILPNNNNNNNQIKANVVGIVSREVNIVRPADFYFTPFSKDEAEEASSLCSTNLFPPAHFISEKSMFEVECDFNGPSLGKNLIQKDENSCGEENELPLQWEFEAMPTLSILATDTNIPPPMLPAQIEMLNRLNGGVDKNDCIEVYTTKKLLEERPVWIAQELLDAVLQSGVCPRSHINKKVLACLTYIIKNGPFNRLRIKIGFNPYENYKTVSLQRIAVKINRRSELGILLRDISRLPHIADVLKELFKEKKDIILKDLENNNSLPYPPRGSFFEKLAKIIQDGKLYAGLQIIDMSDDNFFKNLILKIPLANVLPLENRSGRNGWISEGDYQSATSHILESLSSFIRNEVTPALERYGKNEINIRIKKSPSQSSSTGSEEDDGDDGEVSSLGSAAPVSPQSSDTEAEGG